jgi:thioredoxin reductase (NADPH)
MTGVAFLSKAGELHPNARRALLIARGDRTTAEPILRATALGLIHNYIPKPFATPDEQFHRLVTEFLDAWRQDQGPKFEALHIVDEHWSARSHELRDLLYRSGVPFAFHEAGSKEGRDLIYRAGRTESPLPLVMLYDGRVLTDPSTAEVAQALGVNVTLDDSEFDVIVVGAGPAGLAAAVYGASEGLRVLVVDRETIGGQAGSSSLIRNYLGFPRGLSGSELAARAYEHAWLFGTKFHFGVAVSGLRSEREARLIVLDDGTELRSRAVLLAMGVTYRSLGVPSLESLIGRAVFYGAATAEASAVRGEHVFVVGAGNSAGQAAMHLSKHAGRVTILVRRHHVGLPHQGDWYGRQPGGPLPHRSR